LMIYDFQAASTGFGKKFSILGTYPSLAFFMLKKVISTRPLFVVTNQTVKTTTERVARRVGMKKMPFGQSLK